MNNPEHLRQAVMYLKEHVIVYLLVGLNSRGMWSLFVDMDAYVSEIPVQNFEVQTYDSGF
jgi:hypothetical protein